MEKGRDEARAAGNERRKGRDYPGRETQSETEREGDRERARVKQRARAREREGGEEKERDRHRSPKGIRFARR